MNNSGRAVLLWLRDCALAALPLGATLAVIAAVNRSFFIIDDKEAQYAATYHYIGSELTAGRLPLFVPWQGTSALLVLDPQYGILSPIYWLQNIVFSRFDNLALACFVMAAAYLLTLLAGSVAWLQRLGTPSRWTIVGGFAAAFSGYVVWWVGASWHPGLATIAFLPWLGWALSARPGSPGSALGILGFMYACTSGGWPFTSMIATVLVVASLVELAVSRRWHLAIVQALAAGAGILLAGPTLIIPAFALDWTVRSQSVANNAFLVPNLADVLNTSIPTATANMWDFQDKVLLAPILFAGGIGLAMLPLIDFPRAWWRRTGALTIGLTALAALLLTQSPSDIGPLRWPMRNLAAWQVLLAIGVCAAIGLFGIRRTRVRLVAAGAILAVFGFITLARSPQELTVHVIGILLAFAVLAALALLPGRAAAAGVLTGITLAAMWSVVSYPVNIELGHLNLPREVAAYQNPLGTGPQRSLVLYPPTTDYTAAAQQGVFIGQNYLLGPGRSGLGYSSLSQRYLDAAMCTEAQGAVCPQIADWLASIEPVTGQPWAALIGADTITVHNSFAAQLQRGLRPHGWRSGQRTADFTVLRRPTPPALEGRITHLAQGVRATAADVSATTQRYDVDSAVGGTIVFTDVYWPGYSATWNGQPLTVTPLANSLVSVDVPAGPGTLQVDYRPAGRAAAIASVLAGLLTALLALVLAARGRGRHASRPGSPTAYHEQQVSAARTGTG